MMQAVVQDMTGNDLATYLQKTYIIVHKINETRQTGTVFCICSFNFLKLNRENMKKHCAFFTENFWKTDLLFIT